MASFPSLSSLFSSKQTGDPLTMNQVASMPDSRVSQEALMGAKSQSHTARQNLRQIEDDFVRAQTAYTDAKNAALEVIKSSDVILSKLTSAEGLAKDIEKAETFISLFNLIESSGSVSSINGSLSNENQLRVLTLSSLFPRSVRLVEESESKGDKGEKREPSLEEKKREEQKIRLNAFFTPKARAKESELPSLSLKEIENSLPKDNREIIKKFNELVSALKAACFAFAGRHGLEDYAVPLVPGKPSSLNQHGNDKYPHLRTNLIEVYDEALRFIDGLNAKYYPKDKSSRPLELADFRDDHHLVPHDAIQKNILEHVRKSYLGKEQGELAFEKLKRLILFYKRDEHLFPHERIHHLGGFDYVHEQTEKRISLSLYDYYIICRLLTNPQYKKIVVDLISSNETLISSIDPSGIVPFESLKKMNFQVDTWMSNFVRNVLRNRLPLDIFVLCPDLANALEKSRLANRIGSMIGVQINYGGGSDEEPLSLVDENEIIRFTFNKDSRTNGVHDCYLVEFKVCGKWVDITTAKARSKNLREIIEQPAPNLTPDMSFDEVLRHFETHSKDWGFLEIVNGQGLQVFQRNQQKFQEIKLEERDPDDALLPALRPKPYTKPFTAGQTSKFVPVNYLFTRPRDLALIEAKENGALPGDTICRDHFTAKVTSIEDLREEFPDYDLSPLTNWRSGEWNYGVFWNANRKSCDNAVKDSHGFLTLIIPEMTSEGGGNDLYRVISMAFYPSQFADTLPYGMANFAGRSAAGSFTGDEAHMLANRDKIGQGFILSTYDFAKFCNELQHQINKSRQELLTYQPFGLNGCDRIQKIVRKTQLFKKAGNDQIDVLTRTLVHAKAVQQEVKERNRSKIEVLWSGACDYVLGTTEDHKRQAFQAEKARFFKEIKRAVNRNDIAEVERIMSSLLEHIDMTTDANELFESVAAFLAKIHLDHLTKFKDVLEPVNVTAHPSKKFLKVLENVASKSTHLKPYKQFTSDDDDSFFDTVTANLKKYKARVEATTSREDLEKELRVLLKDFVIQGLKAASPYNISVFDADFGWGVNSIVQAIALIPIEPLRDFIFSCLVFVLVAPWRTRTVKEYNADGDCVREKQKSLWDEMGPARFNLPSQLFDTVRKNDLSVVKEAISCYKIECLKAKITKLPVVDNAVDL